MSENSTGKASLLASSSLFCLLVSICILRALRDEMAMLAGNDSLGSLFTGSFIVICLLAVCLSITSKPMRGFWAIMALVLIILLTWLVQPQDHAWFSVISFMVLSGTNLLLISQFWAVLLQKFNRSFARKYYPKIIMWGSLGVLAGPLLVIQLSAFIPALLSVTASVFLLTAGALLSRIKSGPESETEEADQAAQGSKPSRLAAMILIYSVMGTLVYAEQLDILNQAALLQSERLYFFGLRDFGIGLITLLLHWLNQTWKRKQINWMGLQWMPVLTWGLLLAVGLLSSLEVVLWSMIIFRAVNYAWVRPARETYYFGFGKSVRLKSFIDTVTYRAGDLLGIWFFQWWTFQELGFTQLAISLLPLILIWFIINQKILKSLKLQYE